MKDCGPSPHAVAIVSALQAEAQVFVAAYGLELNAQTPFPFYRGEAFECPIELVVTGVGHVGAATAVGWVAGQSDATRAWLNLGIAGHGEFEPGAIRLVESVRGPGLERLYAVTPFGVPIEFAPLVTVTEPETRFSEPALFDMEASGFWSAALQFSSTELIQSLKVVSDNRTAPARRPSRDEVRTLLGATLEPVEKLIRELAGLARLAASLERVPKSAFELEARFRFSGTLKHRLRKLLRKCELSRSPAQIDAALAGAASAREVIVRLDDLLSRVDWLSNRGLTF